MAVNDKGEITGSVSGGCVEGAVVSASLETIKNGKPQFLHFDVADETAWAVGVACGGQLDVIVRLLDSKLLEVFKRTIETDEAFAVATVVGKDSELLGREFWVSANGNQGGGNIEELNGESINAISEILESGSPAILKYQDTFDVFVDVIMPPPTLIIVGGVHIAVALVKIANAAGYRTVVVDPRRLFGTLARFPEADRIIQKWPDEAFSELKITQNTAVAMLSHDPKIDDPGLISVLPSKAFYVGALGSRKTQESRRERLSKAGVDENLLNKIYGPIGLDLGGRSPEEIALAIMAEIIKVQYLKGREK
jgi:xanthine dehydrogenase accessory factor